jgi:hypothetical protein
MHARLVLALLLIALSSSGCGHTGPAEDVTHVPKTVLAKPDRRIGLVIPVGSGAVVGFVGLDVRGVPWSAIGRMGDDGTVTPLRLPPVPGCPRHTSYDPIGLLPDGRLGYRTYCTAGVNPGRGVDRQYLRAVDLRTGATTGPGQDPMREAGAPMTPSWSPDLREAVAVGPNGELWRLRPAPERLHPGVVEVTEAVWSADGEHLALLAGECRGDHESGIRCREQGIDTMAEHLYFVPVDRSSASPPEPVAERFYYPGRLALSPDGYTLALAASVDDDGWESGVWTVDLRTGRQCRLLRDGPGGGGVPGSPAWSADGRTLGLVIDNRAVLLDVGSAGGRCGGPALAPPGQEH